jgi:hypothetical protein
VGFGGFSSGAGRLPGNVARPWLVWVRLPGNLPQTWAPGESAPVLARFRVTCLGLGRRTWAGASG